MGEFRIYRLRQAQREQFRWAPHTLGVSKVKPKDYQLSGTIEAATPYEAWAALRNTDQPIEIGDLLESTDGKLYLCKYVGFEEAEWYVPSSQTPAQAEAVDPCPSSPSTQG